METNVMSDENLEIFNEVIEVRRRAVESLMIYEAMIEETLSRLDLGNYTSVRVIQASDPSIVVCITKGESKIDMSVSINEDDIPPGIEVS